MKRPAHILKITEFAILLLVASCGKENTRPEIPVVPVSFVINPNTTEYLELNHPGGWIYLKGGYNGILVYRSTMTDFVAFERACPWDWDQENARVWVETAGTTCACPVCGSKFIMTDGTPFEGPSRVILKQYRTTYDGSLLYIYN
jgi:hypothetical protein